MMSREKIIHREQNKNGESEGNNKVLREQNARNGKGKRINST